MAQKAYQVAFAGVAVEDDFYGDVMELTVEENTTAASTLYLRLATTLQADGTWSYLTDDRLTPFTRVKVLIGFQAGGGLASLLGGLLGGGGNDGLEPVFEGYITAAGVSLGSEPGNTYIDVSAMDTSVLMSLEDKIVRWPDLADSDIVQQILSSYDVQVRVDSTSPIHQEKNTTILQRATDVQFVRDLARRNGREFYFETDKDTDAITAYWRAPQLDGTPQSDLAIQFGDESNLRSFTARLNGRRPLIVKAVQMDVQANSPNTGQAAETRLTKLGDKDLNTLMSGPLGRLVRPREAVAQMLVNGPPTSDATELQNIAQAVRDEAGWLITASGEINSDAYGAVLRPHRLVLVKGAGAPYSGKYYVTRVVHTVKSDGSYSQTFEARRNARDVDDSTQFGDSGLGLPFPGG